MTHLLNGLRQIKVVICGVTLNVTGPYQDLEPTNLPAPTILQASTLRFLLTNITTASLKLVICSLQSSTITSKISEKCLR